MAKKRLNSVKRTKKPCHVVLGTFFSGFCVLFCHFNGFFLFPKVPFCTEQRAQNSGHFEYSATSYNFDMFFSVCFSDFPPEFWLVFLLFCLFFFVSLLFSFFLRPTFYPHYAPSLIYFSFNYD